MNEQQINLNVDQDKIDARYCDLVSLSSNALGFTFDFIQQIPQMKTARVLSRIAMSPQHAKMFSDLLKNQVKIYEDAFGEIKISPQMKDDVQRAIGFQPNSKEEK
jgi:replicative superfamily II helicase